MIINNQPKEIMAIVVLEASEDYLFVETGPDGEIEHLNPNLVPGEKQHMVTVKKKCKKCILNIYTRIKFEW